MNKNSIRMIGAIPLNKFWLAVVLIFFSSNINSASRALDLFLPLEEPQINEIKEQLQADFAQAGIDGINIIGRDHWHRYQQGLRSGRPGLFFAPPHFAAWAINQHSFKPLIRLAQPLSYVIATRREDSSLFEINDLGGKDVCADPPLNLSYLLVNQAFGNSLSRANIVVVDSVARAMREPREECVGFSISNHYFEQLSLKFPNRFIRLQQSARYNNYVFIADPEISDSVVNFFQAYLLSRRSKQLFDDLYKEMADTPDLVNAYADDYPNDYWQQLSPYWLRK